ncbi:hypothetical protein Daudx_2119 [Candidatus Desulforudis audaxviator]|nr:hypothetical protein Daudx_2119 [Candidatus Desulforudis audaxviator]
MVGISRICAKSISVIRVRSADVVGSIYNLDFTLSGLFNHFRNVINEIFAVSFSLEKMKAY